MAKQAKQSKQTKSKARAVPRAAVKLPNPAGAKTRAAQGKARRAAPTTGQPPEGAAPTKPKAKRARPVKLPSIGEALRGAGLTGKRPVTDTAQQSRWPAQITIGNRFRLKKSNIEKLAASINARGGLIQPIAIDENDALIDGERRLLAWQHPTCRFRDDPIPVTVINIDDLVHGEYDANTEREPFTPSEAVAIKRALEPRLKVEAKERQRVHGGTAPGRKKKPGEPRTESGEIPRSDGAKPKGAESGRAADRVAGLVGKDRRTIEKAERVVEAAERDPEKYGKLKEDMDRTGRVDAPYRRLKVMEQAAEIRSAPPPLPMRGPYRAGIIDPPWPAEPEEDDPERLARGYYPYPTMSIDALAKLDVPSIMHDDCVVGLWITNFHLALGHHLPLLEAWGLRPVTIRTWVKDRMGRGAVLRGQTEHMIIARRGSPVIDCAALTTFFHAAVNTKAHSQKPQRAYDDFARLVASERYFSLFETTARGEVWDSHGDQVGTRPLPADSASTGADEPGRPKPYPGDLVEYLTSDGADYGVVIPEWSDQDAAGMSRFRVQRTDLNGTPAPVATDAQFVFVSMAEFVRVVRTAAEVDAVQRSDDGPTDDRIATALVEVLHGGVIADAEIRAAAQKRRLITGKSKLRLTKTGETIVQAWCRRKEEQEQLAELPDDIEALVETYKATLARRHAAIVGPEFQYIEGTSIAGKQSEIVARETRRLDLLQQKANGGEQRGVGCDDSPAEQLRRAAAAPIGEVPMWGARGMFRVEVDGMACLVKVDERGWFEAYACSDAPFISETGYRSFPSDIEEGLGLTVDAYASRLIAEEIANPADGSSGRRKARKDAMRTPEKHYRLPASWEMADRPMRVGEPPVAVEAGDLSDGDPEQSPVDGADDARRRLGAEMRMGLSEPREPAPLPPDDPGPIPEFLRRDRDAAEAAE